MDEIVKGVKIVDETGQVTSMLTIVLKCLSKANSCI
jgi:hypothetical protein